MRPIAVNALLAASLAIVGCASTSSLPQSPSEVAPNPGRFEQGYWPRYTANTVLQGVSLEQAAAAGRLALLENGFKLVREEPDHAVLMGEHGTTLFYWNVVAGIYFVPAAGDIHVSVVSVGSKDVGFIELAPNPWPARILESMKKALAAAKE